MPFLTFTEWLWALARSPGNSTANLVPTTMDANALLQCFAATLDQNTAVRQEAESHLKEASKTPGFLGACLDIIGSGSGSDIPESIKLSASLYFKNKIIYGWNTSSQTRNELLNIVVDNDEKPIVKDMLLQSMVSCSKQSPNCVRILQSALAVIIGHDYPKGQWEQLLPKSLELISNGDIDLAHIGLICLSEIFRTFRWKDNDGRQELETLIMNYFPSLLQYANESLLQDPHNCVNDPKIGELLKLIVKIYKFVTYYDLPFTLQRDEFFIPWANLFIKIIQFPLSQEFLSRTDKDERKNYSWVKCKKWSYANLYRLFQRYASSSLSGKFQYKDFKNTFIEQFLPQFLQLLFEQIEQWGAKTLWLSNESLYYILSVLEQCVSQSKTWPLIGPHYEIILRHVITPLLTPDEDTLDTFENDPQEYIHRNLELWDNDYSPDLAATSLLVTTMNKRGKITLQPTMEYVVEVLQANMIGNIELNNAVQIEAVLKIFSNIIDKLLSKKSPFVNDVENLLKTFVFPFFHSKYGFLRTRVCDICSKLGDIEFQDPKTIETIFEGILSCLNDTSESYLPINLSASLALQTFIQEPHFKEALTTSVVTIMQKLLALSNEFESDSISGVMQDFVEQYSEQLQPFGVELMNSLVQQFLKLAIDLNDAANIDPSTLMGSDDIPDETDKQMAALGILSTIISILLSFENSLDIVRSLERSFYPAAEFILKNDIEDFYRELSEFVENSTFLLREITPITWKILELVGDCNRKEDSMVAYYLEDFMLMINNIIVYGGEELKKNEFYSKILFEIYDKFDINEDTSLDELNTVFDLSQKLILALGIQLPLHMREIFLKDTIQSILVEKSELNKNVVFGVTSFNVLIASIISQPLLTLTYMKQTNMLELFLETWLTFYVPNLKRTYDIKLSLMALLSMLDQLTPVNFTELQIESIIPKIGSDLVTLLGKYPVAVQELKDKRKEFSSFDYDAKFDDTEGWDDGDDVNDAEEFDADNDANIQALLKSMNNDGSIQFMDEAPFADGETFDDLDEDPLSKSVLDDIDIYCVFKTAVTHLQSTDAAKYQAVMAQLDPEQQQILSQALTL